MIGWRSSDPECWIDPPGPMYVSDKTYTLYEQKHYMSNGNVYVLDKTYTLYEQKHYMSNGNVYVLDKTYTLYEQTQTLHEQWKCITSWIKHTLCMNKNIT
uniref:Uncharacterized protein n=1 Tax=Cacopsylla melanoneura TaxID=428564 RepID=A0A8D8VH36_9HEMI